MSNTSNSDKWSLEDVFTNSISNEQSGIQAFLASATPPTNKGFTVSENELLEACTEVNSLNAALMLSAIDCLNTRVF